MQNYTILSLDGGGIRGLLTAKILQSLGNSVVANTTVLAGTSTGGILALALAAGIDAQQLVDLYSKRCPNIFGAQFSPASSDAQIREYLHLLTGNAIAANTIWGVIEMGLLKKDLFSAKYSHDGLRQQITNVLGTHATTLLSQLPRRVFVTTYQLDDGNGAWTPISLDNFGSPESHDSAMLDAALSSSAAPTYFPPYEHPLWGPCVDGGMFANDPAMFVLARVLQLGVDPKSIRLLSIGTGETVDGVPRAYFNTVPPEMWGAVQWLDPIKVKGTPLSKGLLLNLLMDGSSEVDDEQAGTMLMTGNYLRVQIPLNQPITLDDCSCTPELEKVADAFVQGSQWPAIQQWVARNFV
ncbi:MAG: patatin-like phospholipase family protein [Acidobacteria bacterium]|nr:patatin-like phospholipase family protein [Acidobacteriota bacterium]MBV9478074.1 patatin-like phospholipase family protein [Acidobacteriota bacterium]